MLDHSGKTNEALTLAKKAYDDASAFLDAKNLAYADTRYVLATIYVHSGKREEAERVAAEYRSMMMAEPYAGHAEFDAWVGESHFIDAQIAASKGDFAAARMEAQSARQLFDRSHDFGSSAEVADFLKTLGA
jgi:hypothetical protein